jgi:hypothetical protein
VDFHLRHHGAGKIDDSFHATRQALINKCEAACRSRWITTTCTAFPISASTLMQRLATLKSGTSVVKFVMKLRRWVAILVGIERRHRSPSDSYRDQQN